MKNKMFLIKKIVPLTCTWVPTGDAKHPLACFWTSGKDAQDLDSKAPADEPGRMYLCA